MRTLPTIIAVVIAALTVLIAVLVAPDETDPNQSDSGASPLLLRAEQLPVDDVTTIRLTRADNAYTFQRSGNQWRQSEPFMFPMDPFSIRQLAAQARELTVWEEVADPSPDMLETLSLSPPQATVQYEWGDETLSLHLGRRGIAGRAYLQIAGDSRVFIVSNELHERAVSMDTREWRTRRIFQHASIDSEIVTREGGDSRFVMERDRRRWMFTHPVQTRADTVSVENYFQSLAKATLTGFIIDQPDDLARFGLAEPIGTIEVVSPQPPQDDGKATVTERLLIGARVNSATQDRFAMIDGFATVIRVPEALLRAIYQPLSELIDPTASGVQPADVKAIVIQTAADSLRLERNLERWIAPEHGSRSVPTEDVNELLHQLCELRAPAVEIEPYPAELEVASVTLLGFDGRPRTTVRIVRKGEDGPWGLENGDDVLRVLPAATSLKLRPADYGLSLSATVQP